MDELRLIDLPGYGYAKVSQAERRGWQPLIEGYTRTRRALALFVMLIDARRGIEDEERQLYEWLGTENVPAQIVFTKVDKLSASARGLLRERARASFRGGRRAGGPADGLGRRPARASTRCGRRSSTPSGDGSRRPNLRRERRALSVVRGTSGMAVNKLQHGLRRRADEARRSGRRHGDREGVVPLADDRAGCCSRRWGANGPTSTSCATALRRSVVAFTNYWLVADEVHLLNLATHPEARRAGHASRLLAHIIEVGRTPRVPLRHARGSAFERGRGAALPSLRLQGGRRSPELLRGGPGGRDRDAAGPGLTWR